MYNGTEHGNPWDIGTLNKEAIWSVYIIFNYVGAVLNLVMLVSIHIMPKPGSIDVLIGGLCSGCAWMSLTCGSQCLASVIHGYFYGGRLACELEAFFHISAILVQFACVAMVAVRAYLEVVRNRPVTNREATVAVVIAWLVCTSVTAFLSRLKHPASAPDLMSAGTYCFYDFSSPAIAGWLVPMLGVAVVVMAFCYVCIYRVVRLIQSRISPGGASKSSGHSGGNSGGGGGGSVDSPRTHGSPPLHLVAQARRLSDVAPHPTKELTDLSTAVSMPPSPPAPPNEWSPSTPSRPLQQPQRYRDLAIASDLPCAVPSSSTPPSNTDSLHVHPSAASVTYRPHTADPLLSSGSSSSSSSSSEGGPPNYNPFSKTRRAQRARLVSAPSPRRRSPSARGLPSPRQRQYGGQEQPQAPEKTRRQLTLNVVLHALMYLAVLLVGWAAAAVTAVYELSIGRATEALVTAVGVFGTFHSVLVPLVYSRFGNRYHWRAIKRCLLCRLCDRKVAWKVGQTQVEPLPVESRPHHSHHLNAQVAQRPFTPILHPLQPVLDRPPPPRLELAAPTAALTDSPHLEEAARHEHQHEQQQSSPSGQLLRLPPPVGHRPSVVAGPLSGESSPDTPPPLPFRKPRPIAPFPH